MEYLKRLIEASTKVYECYLKIVDAEVKRKEGNLKENELDDLMSELDSLAMHEDMCLEEFFLKTGDDELSKALDEVYSNSMNLEEDILIRLISKTGRRIENPADKEKTVSEGAQKLLEQTKQNEELNSFISEHEKEIKEDLEDKLLEFEEEYELSNERNLEIQRNLSFFLDGEIEKEPNPDIYRELIKLKLTNLYVNPDIESEMIRTKFHLDSTVICVENFVATDEFTRIEYELSKVRNTGSLISEIVSCLTGNEWDDSISDYINLSIMKCSLRAILYSIDDIHYEEFLELIQDDDEINKNEAAKKFFSEVIEESKNDRQKYPYIKFSDPMQKSPSIQMVKTIYELYEKLAELEIRRYDGEDTDFEFQKVLDAIKIALPEENKVVYKEMQDSLVEGKNGQVHLIMAVDHSNALFHDRIDEIIKRNFSKLMMAEYQKQGIDVIVGEGEENPLKGDIQKSFIFFINQTASILPKETRDVLIRKKYDQIYGNPIFEEELLDNGCLVSKEWMQLLANFGMSNEEIEYYDMLGESNIISEINNILENLNEINFGDDLLDKEGIFVWFTIAFRSILYVASEGIYEKLKTQLDKVKKQMINDGKEVYAQIIDTTLEESVKDREKYPKLVL